MILHFKSKGGGGAVIWKWAFNELFRSTGTPDGLGLQLVGSLALKWGWNKLWEASCDGVRCQLLLNALLFIQNPVKRMQFENTHTHTCIYPPVLFWCELPCLRYLLSRCLPSLKYEGTRRHVCCNKTYIWNQTSFQQFRGGTIAFWFHCAIGRKSVQTRQLAQPRRMAFVLTTCPVRLSCSVVQCSSGHLSSISFMKLLTRSKDQLRLGMNCPFKHRQEHLRVFRQALKYAGLGVRSSNILLPVWDRSCRQHCTTERVQACVSKRWAGVEQVKPWDIDGFPR